MEDEQYYNSSSAHHWYGHVSDVQYDNPLFLNCVKWFFILFFVVPLIILYPPLGGLVLLRWAFSK